MCLSILPAARYFLRSLRRTLILLIQRSLEGIRALRVPRLLPKPTRSAERGQTNTSVVASVLGLLSALDTRAGVNGLRLADDETVLNQFADILTRVSQSNFSNFVGIHPDLALTTLKDGSSESK